MKLPLCDLVMLSTAGNALTMVESVALALAETPPDTLTTFASGEVALAATFTVTVMGG
jgi:hypothetical protein